MMGFGGVLKVWLVVSAALSATKQVTATELLRCAERGTVLLAGECHLPLSQGPCPTGHTILASEDGTGFCSPWKCKEDEVLWSNGTLEVCIEFESSVCSGQGERVWAKPDGGWECGCRDGWGRKRGEGECQQLGAACGQQGRILQAVGDERCKDNCVHFSQCQHFMNQVTKASLLRRRAGMFQSYLDLLGPLRDSVCNRKEKKVCCLSSFSTLPKLAREEQVLECQENPCSGEPTPSIPWPDKEGCFPLPARPSSCNLVLNENENRLECEPADSLGVRGVAVPAGRSRCPRRKVWSRFQGRCVRRF